MLEELKKCNSIGNVKGILFLVSVTIGKEWLSKEEIKNRCALENNITLNCEGAIAFFEYLRLFKIDEDMIIPSSELNDLEKSAGEEIINCLVELCIARLIEDGIFDMDVTGFDTDTGCLTIKRSAFPLPYAAIRNFLILVGALDNGGTSKIAIPENYEKDWTKQLEKRRKKITLEQLQRQQEDQSRRGLEAEEFVLSLEKKRLPELGEKIKRISDFDVAAGYDIVSFESYGTEHYDRFIEVKCYIGTPHFFWSENESDVAKRKADKYLLCLVDYLKIEEPGYFPEFIRNPYKIIFEGGDWMVDVSSYKVKKT